MSDFDLFKLGPAASADEFSVDINFGSFESGLSSVLNDVNDFSVQNPKPDDIESLHTLDTLHDIFFDISSLPTDVDPSCNSPGLQFVSNAVAEGAYPDQSDRSEDMELDDPLLDDIPELSVDQIFSLDILQPSNAEPASVTEYLLSPCESAITESVLADKKATSVVVCSEASHPVCDRKSIQPIKDISVCSSENMVAPLFCNVLRPPKFVELPKLKVADGYHVRPTCVKGKTMHAFGYCNPKVCQLANIAISQQLEQCSKEKTMVTDNSTATMIPLWDRNSKGTRPPQTPQLLRTSSRQNTKLSNSSANIEIIPVKKSEAFRNKSTKRSAEDLPFWSMKATAQTNNFSKKNKYHVKAYELEPLSDPKLERCRRNAINAKKNREAKKEFVNMLQTELQSSQEKNEALEQRLQALESTVEKLTSACQQLQEDKQHTAAIVTKLQSENLFLKKKLKAILKN